MENLRHVVMYAVCVWATKSKNNYALFYCDLLEQSVLVSWHFSLAIQYHQILCWPSECVCAWREGSIVNLHSCNLFIWNTMYIHEVLNSHYLLLLFCVILFGYQVLFYLYFIFNLFVCSFGKFYYCLYCFKLQFLYSLISLSYCLVLLLLCCFSDHKQYCISGTTPRYSGIMIMFGSLNAFSQVSSGCICIGSAVSLLESRE